jgi:FtsH-binding integral membrane protein
LGAAFVLMLVIVCGKNKVRASPWNYLLLAAFTVTMAIMVSFFCGFVDPFIVLVAAITTCAMTMGLTLTALCVKREMTWAKDVGGAMVGTLFPLILFFYIWPNLWLVNILSFVGAIFCSIYIVLDTKSVMARLEMSDAIIGTLYIYCDII